MWGQTGASFEEAREMVGAHVDQSTELHEAKLSLQMLADVLSDPPESVWRQVTAILSCRAGRCRERVKHALHGVQRSAPRTASSSA
jgi:hypothetical protein